MAGLKVNVLGPLEVIVDGEVVDLTTGRLRALLAVLAMSPGRVMSLERLATAVWGEKLPGNARRSLQTYAGRLRTALTGQWVGSGPTGLVLNVNPDDVDASRFERLVREAVVEPDPDAERAKMVEALSLWRGEAFEGVDCDWLLRTETPRLRERFLTTLEGRIDRDLAAGRHTELVGELNELTARYPIREPLWARLLVTLERCGRPAEALDHFERIRARLADELGTNPGPELRRLHGELLAGRTPRWGDDVARASRSTVTPRQLPAEIRGFTGRVAALRSLDGVLGDGDRNSPVCVISGTAGVGKTTLAVRWARWVADRFPDGQLYVDLQGFGPTDRPLDPAEVAGTFLVSLGVAPRSVPDGLEARAGLYRSLLADRRVLVVLDNARDAEQVRPLLPSGYDCLTIVTSRDRLTGLVAATSAHPVTLPLLSADESRLLLSARLGTGRTAHEPGAVAAIVELCAGLPLALSVVAARAALNPEQPLETLAARLRASRDSLDAFDVGDVTTDMRAVLSWSYRALSDDAARLFRLLAGHPGAEVSVESAASLAGRPVTETRTLLSELVRACLLTERPGDRYSGHDLLRTYAAELTDVRDSSAHRRAAFRRLVDHYLHTGHRAALLFDPFRPPLKLKRPDSAVTVTALSQPQEALEWFTAEHASLTAVVTRTAARGWDSHCWQLAWTMTGYLDRKGHWRDWTRIQDIALAAAQRTGDLCQQASTHRVLGRGHTRLGDYQLAGEHFELALCAYAEVGDLIGQANTHTNLGQIDDRHDRHAEAIAHNRKALELYRRAGRRDGEADAFNNLGWSHAKLGILDEASDYCAQALRLYQALGDTDGEASAWDSMGYVYHRRGDHTAAVRCYDRVLARYRELGTDRYHSARTLTHLGDSHLAAGDGVAAHEHYQQALTIFENMRHDDAVAVRAKLRACDTTVVALDDID